MGGMDRVATVVKAIKADRPDAILLDGGDTWHGSMTSYLTKGQDMVNVMNKLGVDAMTSHWEWTFGTDRVMEIVDNLPFPFLGQNIFDAMWDEPAEFPDYTWFERGGAKVAVIGQAFPYMPIANPGWMFPEYSFGIRDQRMQKWSTRCAGRAPTWSWCCRITVSTWTARWPAASTALTLS